MQYTISAEGGGLCVELSGDLTFDSYREFKSVMNEIKADSKAIKFCLAGVNNMDSAGAGLLKLAHTKAQDNKLPFEVINVPKNLETLVSIVML